MAEELVDVADEVETKMGRPTSGHLYQLFTTSTGGEKSKWEVISSEGDDMIQVCRGVGEMEYSNDLIHVRLRHAWNKLLKRDQSSTSNDEIEFDSEQKKLKDAMFRGVDLYDLRAGWEGRGSRMQLYCLYILNEIINYREMIVRNNKILMERPEEEIRDQGFTRPRILILTPFRNTALDIIDTLGKLWLCQGNGFQIDNQKRLAEEFGPSEEDSETDLRRRNDPSIPEDFKDTFRENIDDCFRIGIKCTRKAMKLFCDFYSCDIIIASPLGLRFITEGQSDIIKVAKGKGKGKTTDSTSGNRGRMVKRRKVKKGDADFLSSIQLLLIEQSEVMQMQNWDHLPHLIGQRLNQIPTKSHQECDFSRVENVFLDGKGALTRQNIIFSSHPFPTLKQFISEEGCLGSGGVGNIRGKCELSCAVHDGVVKSTFTKDSPLCPEFHLLPCQNINDPTSIPTARLTYFTQTILPTCTSNETSICIFISSYFDFVQLRQYMTTHLISHAILSEYCSNAETLTARNRFYKGEVRFLLITERFHFFKRFRIRGIRRLIFYSPPEHAAYLNDFVRLVEQVKGRAGSQTVPILFSPFDRLAMERIVGTKRIARIYPE